MPGHPGFEADIHAREAGSFEEGEQILVDVVRAADEEEAHAQAAAQHLFPEGVGALPSDPARAHEVVVGELDVRDAESPLQILDLVHDVGRTACAPRLAFREVVEGPDAAEAAPSVAAAAGEDRGDPVPSDLVLIRISDGERKGIEALYQGTRGVCDDPPGTVANGQAMHVVPIGAARKAGRQLRERLLAFAQDDGVHAGQLVEDLLVIECRVVSTERDVAGVAPLAEEGDDPDALPHVVQESREADGQ